MRYFKSYFIILQIFLIYLPSLAHDLPLEDARLLDEPQDFRPVIPAPLPIIQPIDYPGGPLPKSKSILLVATHLATSGVSATGTFLCSKGLLEQQPWLACFGGSLALAGETARVISDGFQTTDGIVPGVTWFDRLRNGLFKPEFIPSYLVRFFSGVVQPSQVILPWILNNDLAFGFAITGLALCSTLDLVCINCLTQKLQLLTGSMQGR